MDSTYLEEVWGHLLLAQAALHMLCGTSLIRGPCQKLCEEAEGSPLL